MGSKATVGSTLAGLKNWDALTLEGEKLDHLAAFLKTSGRPLDAQVLAQKLGEALAEPTSTPTPRNAEKVKKYLHQCNFEEGERVFVDNRYGKSLATISKIVRQPPTAFCDKAFLEFDDADYRSRWEAERSTPYFAINSGRANATPVYVDAASASPAQRQRRYQLNATATAKLARVIEKALSTDSRFIQFPHGWYLEGAPLPALQTRAHISAEPGGAAIAALAQGSYKAPVLEAIDKLGEATIEDIKRNVQGSLKLSPADWETDATGKIVWIHRLHAAIKHLKRVGTIDSPRREVYRRVRLQRESA